MNRLTSRVMSSFGVSIGTGLMLESLFEPTYERYDKDREIPNKIKIDNYNIHLINLHMVIRNIISASGNHKEYHIYFKNDTLFKIALEELDNIQYLYSNSDCIPILFVPNYSNIRKSLNYEKNVPYNDFEFGIDTYINKMLSNYKDVLTIPLIETYKIPSEFNNQKVLISTSYPVDLLNIDKVKSMDLLESHTGKLKKPDLWYTKYHKFGKNDLSHLPFNELLLYIFGDGKMIMSLPVKMKRLLLELSIKEKWTPKTGLLKMKNDIVHVPELHDIVKHLKYQY